MLMFDELSDRPAAAREGLVPNPKARLKAQFHEVCRFKHLAVRSEEAYLQWIKRFMVFHREKAEILKPEILKPEILKPERLKAEMLKVESRNGVAAQQHRTFN